MSEDNEKSVDSTVAGIEFVTTVQPKPVFQLGDQKHCCWESGGD